VVCVADDLEVFCRRLAADVNQSPLHLSRVMSGGAQVYPVRRDVVHHSATPLECEFRMRKSGSPVTELPARDLLARIRHLEVVRAWLADDDGTELVVLDEMRAAG
jgi:hypothetical protein